MGIIIHDHYLCPIYGLPLAVTLGLHACGPPVGEVFFARDTPLDDAPSSAYRDCTLGLPLQLTPKVQRPIYDQVQQGCGLPVFLLPFVTGWKDADADIPILKEVKAEYAKLQ
jgi:hypothetical protein